MIDRALLTRFTATRMPRKEAGQGIVEFALTLPFLLLMLFGVIEAGRLLFIYSATNTSSREAARYGSASGSAVGNAVNFKDCSGIRAAAKKMGFLAGIQDGDIVITYDQGPGTTEFAVCSDAFTITSPDIGRRVDLGDRVIVRVSAQFQPVLPLVNFPPFTIQSTTARTVIKDVSMGAQ